MVRKLVEEIRSKKFYLTVKRICAIVNSLIRKEALKCLEELKVRVWEFN